MFLDIAPSEFLVIAGAAIIFIGPKDMPRALRTAGKWFAQMRRVSNHFRAGIDNMIREAELAEMEKEWAERNAAIMAGGPTAGAVMTGETASGLPAQVAGEHAAIAGGMVPQWPTPHALPLAPVPPAGAEAGEPELPLSTPRQPLGAAHHSLGAAQHAHDAPPP